MSLLQELEIAGNKLDSETKSFLNLYLDTHPDLFLDDVYYGEGEWEKFEEWCHRHAQRHNQVEGYCEVSLQEEHKQFIDENLYRFGYVLIDDKTYEQLNRNTQKVLVREFAEVTSEMDQRYHDPYYEIHSMTDYVLGKAKDNPKLIQEILDNAKQKAYDIEKEKKHSEKDEYTKQVEEDEIGYSGMKSNLNHEHIHEEH